MSISIGEGIGNSGDINISTKNLILSRSGDLSTSSFGQGNAGNINIDAELITLGEQGDTFLSSLSSIRSNAIGSLLGDSQTEGNAGNIIINTQSLSINDGSDISVDTFIIGDGGDIIINASDSVLVSGSGFLTAPEFDDSGQIISGSEREVEIPSNISSSVFEDGVGNAGNIEINTPELTISNQAEVEAITLGQGNGGSIFINAPQLSIIEGELNTFSGGQGNAGSISINADDFVRVEGDDGSIRAGTNAGSIGNGGNLTIETGQLFAVDGAQISSGSLGQGNAGNLIINARESIELSGGNENGSSGLFANALVEDGNGGDLQISTGNLIIRDGATINVSNFPSVEGLQEPGTGEAGNLTIKANSLEIEDFGRINAATQAGDGGNITLDIADNITLRDSSFISARALQDANGGNINIDTNFIVAFPQGNNDIIATAERGNGGNININAQSLFGIQQRPLNPNTNDINASSEFSLDGNITISTPDLNPVQGATELPANIVEPGETTAQACQANRETESKNGLTISGKGGIIPDPASPLNSLNATIDGEINPTSVIPAPIETSIGKIQPARGVKVTESGKVILTAYRTNNSGDRIPDKRNCS